VGWWPAVFLVLIIQVMTPLFALSALAMPMTAAWANPATTAPMCAARGPDQTPSAPLSHHDGTCPACAFCAAVQPALTPAPVSAPLPRLRSALPLAPSVTITRQASAPIQANARSPPTAVLPARSAGLHAA
jgi:hypothetical protein